jgi:hypothetical protein
MIRVNRRAPSPQGSRTKHPYGRPCVAALVVGVPSRGRQEGCHAGPPYQRVTCVDFDPALGLTSGFNHSQWHNPYWQVPVPALRAKSSAIASRCTPASDSRTVITIPVQSFPPWQRTSTQPSSMLAATVLIIRAISSLLFSRMTIYSLWGSTGGSMAGLISRY